MISPNGWDSWPSTIRSSYSSQWPSSTSSWRTEPVYGKGLRTLSLATLTALAAAGSLVFFYAPEDADQGISQEIFCGHVPMAIVALCGFVVCAIFAIKRLRSGERSWDMPSYVAMRLSIILGLGTLI